MLVLQATVLCFALSTAPDFELLQFSASWCGPCRDMAPLIDQFQQQGYPIRKIDVDQYPMTASQFQIRGVPAFVLLADGREVSRLQGAVTPQQLRQLFVRAGYRHGSIEDGSRELINNGRSHHPREMEPAVPLAPSATHEIKRHALDAASGNAIRVATRATVRLKVQEVDGHSFGTGTVVHVHEDEALVLTCGHLFRNSRGQGTIQVILFTETGEHTVPGQLIAYEADERDIGFVSIRPGISIVPARIAAQPLTRPGDAVFSLGCDRGSTPHLRQSRIKAVNKYLGPDNYVVNDRPVDGRSGGGLFDRAGHLIGVCNAADPSTNEGLYAALRTVQDVLERHGLAFVYQHQYENTNAVVVNASHVEPRAAVTHDCTGQNVEVVCIVRSRTDPTANSEVIVFDNPSTDFMNQLTKEKQLRDMAFETSTRVRRPMLRFGRGSKP